MNLGFAIAAMPLWLFGLILIGVSVAAASASVFYVRSRIGLEALIVNNEVAGFKYATLGVIYAVLLTFIIIEVWDEYRGAEISAEHEAGVLDAMYRLSVGLPENMRRDVQSTLRSYAEAVVVDEWPTMARGQLSPAARAALSDVYASYMSIDAETEREARLLSVSLDLLSDLAEGRRERLNAAAGSIPGILWFAMVVGALVVVGFTFFFGSPNIKAQMAMTGLLCLSVMMLISVAVALNHPFTGDVSVSPEPFERLIGLMQEMDSRVTR